MKLLNQSLLYISLAFLLIIGIWAVVFYFNLKEEIRDSIDDGLDNNKMLILQKVKVDSTLLLQTEFGGNNFKIRPISKQHALSINDRFKDTLMYRQNENDLEPVRILHSAFEHQDNYYQIKIISSLVEEDDLVEEAFWSVVWLFIILITSIIIINNIVLRKLWKPFYKILNQLKSFRIDRNQLPISITTNTKEFEQLQQASNALIQHAQKAYTSQKEFTENASHELQTPIAVIVNKLELLLESEKLNEVDAQTIAEVIDIADRLKKLNNSLLLLAKIENKQFLTSQTISLNEVTTTFLSDFKDWAAFKNIEIELKKLGDFNHNMNQALAEILISNLIRNAVFHNIKDGSVDINITTERFIICNSGVSEALDPKIIFNRFVKNPSKSQSTGLGLAICKAICKLYDLELTYHFAGNKHCFTIYKKSNSLV